MIGWLIFIVYGTGAVLSARPIARWLLRNLGSTPPDDADYVFSGAIGVILAFVWPLLLVGLLVLPVVKKLGADTPIKPGDHD